MARLDQTKLDEILKKTAKFNELGACTAHHDRLRLHVEEADSMEGCPGTALKAFLKRSAAVMTADKYTRFTQLLRFPLESNKLTKKIFADLRRVFDGKNRVIRHQFVSAAAAADMEVYRREYLKDEEFFEEDVFENIQVGINDFIIVDVLENRINGRPQAQPFILSVDKVVDVKVNRDNICEYIVYEPDKETRVILDDSYYRVYAMGEDRTWVLKVENEHFLGECPAKSIWSDYMHPSRNFIEKRGPISTSVSDMDEVNFWDVGRRYYELYGAFPIYWEYKLPCKYHDERNNYCEDGWITYEEWPDEYDTTSGSKLTKEPVMRQKRCPACEKNENLFAGTTMYIDAPKSREEADLREPMGFLKVDSAALKHNDERQEKRKREVIDFCVGINTEPMREQAINEKQVSSFFEDRKSVLFRVKRNFEIIHEWTLKIVAKLRYGSQFQSVIVNYGDEFYLRSEGELVKQYGEARKAGLPSYLLQGNRRLLAETRHRTDYQALQRNKILEEVEPYSDYTVAELMTIRQQAPESAIVNNILLAIKLDFSNYIAKFEREEGNILVYGDNLPYNDKIDRIKLKLKEYVTTEITESQRFADEEHARRIERLTAEARANGAGANTGGAAAPKPGKSKNAGGGKATG